MSLVTPPKSPRRCLEELDTAQKYTDGLHLARHTIRPTRFVGSDTPTVRCDQSLRVTSVIVLTPLPTPLEVSQNRGSYFTGKFFLEGEREKKKGWGVK